MHSMHGSLSYRFPGMDPWIERRTIWASFHDALIIHLAEEITSLLQPRYVALAGQRVVVEIPSRNLLPDVLVIQRPPPMTSQGGATLTAEPPVTVVLEPLEVKETFIEIRSVFEEMRVVTVVEVLSGTNKQKGTDSRRKYLQKQQEVLSSDIHLVEVDLLREGEPSVALPVEYLRSFEPHDYRIVIRRAQRRDLADVYPLPLDRRLPRIPIPLRQSDTDAVVDLQVQVERVYQAGGFGIVVDYGHPPEPALTATQALWAERILEGGRS